MLFLLKLTRIFTKISVMSTKLTLTLEKEVIEMAKKYAKDKGQSLSEIVENYFKFISEKRVVKKEKNLSSRVKKLRGVIKVDDDFDYKKILTEELSKKYGV